MLALTILYLTSHSLHGFLARVFIYKLPRLYLLQDHFAKSDSVTSHTKIPHKFTSAYCQRAAMITKMSESPTSTCSPSVFQLSQSTSSFCSSPRGNVTTEPRRKDGSPKSPTQESLSQKRARSRQGPYQNNKSPSGSCCSSSDESNETDIEGAPTEVEARTKRVQANSRERKRMHTVNSAFDQLRELVPTYPSNRKLSKIDTLRLACTYIQDLVSVLHQTRTMQGLQGEDLTQFPVYGDGYLNGPYSSCFSVKSEATMTEFPAAFTNYRMPSTCITPVSSVHVI